MSPHNGGDVKSEKHFDKQNQGEKFSNQIFVGGIPWKTTPQQFREWADETWPGLVTGVRLICTPEKFNSKYPLPSRPRGFGFVTFNNPQTASSAVQKHHFTFSGERTVEVKKVNLSLV
jgi:RNA recognition motif-containing protein